MSFTDKVKNKLQSNKPRTTACIIYVRPLPLIADDKVPAGDDFRFKVVRDPTDPHLRQLETPERLEQMKGPFARGTFVILAIHIPTDRAIGKMWIMTRTPEAGDAKRGMLPIHLARDEVFLFDLWVDPEFRRQAVGFTMAYELGAAVDAYFPDARWVYGYAHKDNEASRNLMELLYGMWPVQEITEIEVGLSYVNMVPNSDSPKFGPFSKKGRHSGDAFSMPGRPRSGDTSQNYHHVDGFARQKMEAELSDSWFWSGAEWFDNDHPLDANGQPATPETLPRELPEG